MRFQAGIQVTLLIVAIVIAVSVVKPKIESIRSEQSEVEAYREAVANINRYNQKLQELTSQSSAISSYDRAVLWRYLPEEIDATAVARDIANIVSQNRLLLLDIVPDQVAPVTSEATFEDPSLMPADTGVLADDGTVTAGVLVAQQFQLEVVGTYDQMKAMLRDLERNAYPLRLMEFEFSQEGEGSSLVQYSLLLETYAMPSTNQ